MGLGEFQVGRSHECDYPAAVATLPVCTRPAIDVSGSSAEIDRLVKARVSAALSVYEVDASLIRSLRPTHIITQTQCKGCAVSVEDVERALEREFSIQARVISLEPFALRDVWEDIRRVARACDREASGETLVEELKQRMHATEMRAKSGRRQTVAAIEWLEPLMAAGNWIPELVEMAGGENLFGTAGQHAPWMSWEQLLAADPDTIVALPCGFDLARTRSEMRWLSGRAEWGDLKAVRTDRVFVCDGNQFMNRPGPRLTESLQIFAEILHPEMFEMALEGIGWERFRA